MSIGTEYVEWKRRALEAEARAERVEALLLDALTFNNEDAKAACSAEVDAAGLASILQDSEGMRRALRARAEQVERALAALRASVVTDPSGAERIHAALVAAGVPEEDEVSGVLGLEEHVARALTALKRAEADIRTVLDVLLHGAEDGTALTEHGAEALRWAHLALVEKDSLSARCARAEADNAALLAAFSERDVQWARRSDWQGLCPLRITHGCEGTDGRVSAVGTPRPKPHGEHCPFRLLTQDHPGALLLAELEALRRVRGAAEPMRHMAALIIRMFGDGPDDRCIRRTPDGADLTHEVTVGDCKALLAACDALDGLKR